MTPTKIYLADAETEKRKEVGQLNWRALLAPINYLGKIGPVPRDLGEEVGEPVVKDSGVVLNLPAVWQRHILTILVYPIIDCAKAQAALRFKICHKCGDKGGGAKGGTQVRLKGFACQVWCYAVNVPVMNSPPQCLRRQGWVRGVLAEGSKLKRVFRGW